MFLWQGLPPNCPEKLGGRFGYFFRFLLEGGEGESEGGGVSFVIENCQNSFRDLQML